MTHLMQKNERRARRKAGLLTFLITASLAAAAAYFGGALDPYFAQPEVVDAAVAVMP